MTGIAGDVEVTTTADVLGRDYLALVRVLGYTTVGMTSWAPLDPTTRTPIGLRMYTITGAGDRGSRAVSGRSLDIVKAALLKEILR